MVTLSESPTLPGWERSSSLARRLGTMTIATVSSDKPSRRSDSGVWHVDDPSLTTLQVPRAALPVDELETLPKARAPRLDEEDVITIPQARRAERRLEDEPVTMPMDRRSPLADGDETVTNRMPRRSSAPSSTSMPGPTSSAPHPLRPHPLKTGPPSPEPRSPILVVDEALLVDEDSQGDLATVPANVKRPFEPDDAVGGVPPTERQAPERGAFDPRVSDRGLPVPPETPSAPEPAASFPGRAFGSQLAPTSQIDRPAGPSVGGRAVSVLVAVAVVSLVLLAAAMILTERSGLEAFTELLGQLGLR